jgi:aromatic-L-amino-acid/L-tryptophan decarboxylase
MDHEHDSLGLDAETMRRLGYQTVDMLVEWMADPGGGPVLRRGSRDELESRLGGAAPEGPRDFAEILGKLRGDVFPFASRSDHPGYFAFIPSCGTWPSALADLIASTCNFYTGSWMESAGPSQVELTVIDWFKQWIGYPAEAAGVLVSGGSAANMTALACARETLLGAMSDQVVAYVSDQAHSSLARAARILGFRPSQVRVLPVDEHYRMRADALVGAMAADRNAGRRPLFVTASAGSTNTGAIDPLEELASICREAGVWFHVDGAYGGFAALTERGKHALRGIQQADSVTLDPHKWLYQPFECGCLLVRDGRRLREAFEITPDYLKDAVTGAREVNFADYGIQLSRMWRAAKLWVSLQYFGVSAFRRMIDRSMDLALLAQERIRRSPRLELLAPVSLSTVCFRRRFEGLQDEDRQERLNAGLGAGLEASGIGLISSTRLRGRFALRLCVLNHTSTSEHVERVLDWIEQAPLGDVADIRPEAKTDAGSPRGLDVTRGWLEQGALDSASLARVPLFAGLTQVQLEEIARDGWQRGAVPGETVVRRWDGSREFFLVLDGAGEVRAGERFLGTIGPGDFFGELAALDWGASFGYVRLATVTATTKMRLLVLPSTTLNRLVREAPTLDDRLRQAVQERLPGL